MKHKYKFKNEDIIYDPIKRRIGLVRFPGFDMLDQPVYAYAVCERQVTGKFCEVMGAVTAHERWIKIGTAN